MTDPQATTPFTGRQPRVLVMADWYAPGFRAGGPIRSVVNLAAQLDRELDIYVLTTDRDLGMDAPYPGIQTDEWIEYGGHHVCYLSPRNLNWRSITDNIRKIRPDHIHLNSMFSRFMTIYPLMFRRFGGTRAAVLLAPRGMLMASALAVKPLRKRVFLTLLRITGIGHIIRFQATNEEEVLDVQRHFGPHADVVRLGNLPAPVPAFVSPPPKSPGMLKMVFIGRAHPIKQPDYLIGLLSDLHQRISLTMVMTREDDAYAAHCRQLAAAMPSNISVTFREDVPHDEITDIIRSNHIFALPTRGENFGHSIYEALAAGRPVLVSDQTPWRGLPEKRAGWDLPLGDPAGFQRCIADLADMDSTELLEWCRGAWQLARSASEDNADRNNYITQFSSCIS